MFAKKVSLFLKALEILAMDNLEVSMLEFCIVLQEIAIIIAVTTIIIC